MVGGKRMRLRLLGPRRRLLPACRRGRPRHALCDERHDIAPRREAKSRRHRPARPPAGSSVARYVFTDLGIVASRDSLLLQLRSHRRLYEFLCTVLDENVREAYQSLREGEYNPSLEILSYGCLFLALDRFAQGRGPGLPVADLGKVAQIVLTGGAAQDLLEDVIAQVVNLLVPNGGSNSVVVIDGRYRIWIDGITWSGHASG